MTPVCAGDLNRAGELRFAQEVIATGHMLETDPRFEDVMIHFSQRSQELLMGSPDVTQSWLQEQLQDALPKIDNKIAAAAMSAASSEIVRGTRDAASVFSTSALSGEDYNLRNDVMQTALRSGLEGMKAAASASDLYLLNHLELEYGLSEGGISEFSVLSIQPLWFSKNLQHNIFAQASYANKEIEDIAATTSGRRGTVNTGLAYRYITPDMQHMFGASVFFDHQWPYHHNRLSWGLDYKTSLYGVAFNKYLGLSDWKGRNDGYEEKALGGEDIELSGRLPQAPELELFVKGFHLSQEKTPVINPDGDDIWGYQFAAEYTPVNAFTIRSQATKDNEMDGMEGQITIRLNYRFGQGWDDLWERPSYNLNSVQDRRFEKIRRNNEIRVQVRRQATDMTDMTPLTVLGFSAVSSGGDPATSGDVITITLDANRDLIQNGAPTLTLNIGGTSRTAVFSAINAGNAEFIYTVQAGDIDVDGVTITAINVAANELEDASGNDLDTTFALPNNLNFNVSTFILGRPSCPAGNLSTPANSGCARLFGADSTSINDVMIYAGDVPGTGVDFFVRRCDLGQDYDPVDARCEGAGGNPAIRSVIPWKDTNTESNTTNIPTGTAWTNVNAIDGPGNTATLVADASGTHTAAESCNALPGGGWYLPAISELDVIYANLNATDDPEHPLTTVNNALDTVNSGTTGPLRDSFNLAGQSYYASSEGNAGLAWTQRFSDGDQAALSKTNNRNVRCARR